MADPNADMEPQDAAEAFDEDNLDPSETNEFRTFEENPDLLDLTQAEGDEDEDDPSAESLDDDDLEEEIEAARGEGYAETDLDDAVDLDAQDHVSDPAPGETPLVYVGDVEDLKGAQGSAAHFESRGELSDDDVESLGYGAEEEDQA